ncbi:hypothetical protein HPB51_000036 [Rhipicephalus microplus]|uniref:CCHC-type domain-containing protein n=1 Tax=Rhipicephalus microplus TaxID=6941 RepID=A0A9J6D3F4_RHIMP|nr:hypothetical protein HPB51_000036 [Rhipicephalus microplus]
MLRTARNPNGLGARCIKNTTMVIILFDGHKVPNYVYCGPIIHRCTLYKGQIDTCRNCGRVGHHQDVCLHPTEKRVTNAAMDPLAQPTSVHHPSMHCKVTLISRATRLVEADTTYPTSLDVAGNSTAGATSNRRLKKQPRHLATRLATSLRPHQCPSQPP